jgi:acyl carrier protein
MERREAMESNQVQGDVKRLVAEILHLEESEISDVELLANYGLTSIEFLDILAKLERKFNVPFEPEQMNELTCRRLAENVAAGIAARG